MSKKLCFLMSFVLVLGFIGTARAGPIDVNNASFEYDVNGVQITENTYIGNLQGWTLRDTTGWGGGYWFADDEWDAPGFEVADGTVAIFQVTAGDANNDPCDSCIIYQFPDDANAIIVANRRYTLTFNALRLGTDTPVAYGALFYSLGGVNVPPANDVTLASKNALLTSLTWGEGYAGWEEVTVTYTALSGAGSIGETLGVMLGVPYPWLNGYQVAMDNVRLEWYSAAEAWNPSPADGAEDVARDVNLTWSPGLWADKHIVYFGTDFSKVSTRHQDANQGIQDVNIFDPTPGGGLLEPGQAYYWTITEVNEPSVWLGGIWSFTTGGKAKVVYPGNWASGVPALNLLLRWEAGIAAATHDVYLGTSFNDVNDATTATAGIYRGNQPLSDVNYLVPEDLDVRSDYFWRIDEVNTAIGTLVRSDVWRFRTGVFLIVDSFDFYETDEALKAVWKDYWADTGSKNGAQVFVETDPGLVRAGQSMKYNYVSNSSHKVGGKYVGSWAEAATSDLEFASVDWTRGSVKALTIYFQGDPCNGKDTTSLATDQMYVELATGGTTALIEYPDMNVIKEDFWHEWNVSLQDFADGGVTLSNVGTVRIGFGGYYKTGQSAPGAGMTYGYPDTVYFDDIRLYPPRCVPETTGLDVLHGLGDITEDCNTDYSDLDIMTTEWLVSDFNAAAAPPANPPEVWYRFDDGPGETVVKNDGSWDGYDISIHSPNEPNEPKWTTDVAPVLDPCDPNYALDFDGVGDYLSIPNSAPDKFVGTQHMSITAWVMPTAAMAQWDWPSIVESRKASDPGKASGFGFGEWGELIYWWNNDYWDWHCWLYPAVDAWSFVAVAVEPTQATIYLSDGVEVNSATYAVPHAALVDWDFDYNNLIATNTSGVPNRTFKGKIDDVRLYNKTLTYGEIMGLSGIAGEVYVPNESVANIAPKTPTPQHHDPNDPDIVNFKDYGILADNWLEQHPWP